MFVSIYIYRCYPKTVLDPALAIYVIYNRIILQIIVYIHIYLSRCYPKTVLDLVLVEGHFGPELVMQVRARVCVCMYVCMYVCVYVCVLTESAPSS
jgi:hypothetical protein